MYDRIIIDGYNLMHSLDTGGRQKLEDRRHALLRRLEQCAGAMAKHITLVFDGAMQAGKTDYEHTFIELIFSQPGMTADATIERIALSTPKPQGILVVTSDRMEIDAVTAAGASVMSCRMFAETIEHQTSYDLQRIQRINTRNRGATLGDFFPEPV